MENIHKLHWIPTMRDHVASRYGDGYGRTHLYCSCGWRSGDYVRDATSDKHMAACVAAQIVASTRPEDFMVTASRVVR